MWNCMLFSVNTHTLPKTNKWLASADAFKVAAVGGAGGGHVEEPCAVGEA